MDTPNGKRNISKEQEDEIYERRLLGQLDCVEKLNKGRNEKNIFLIHNNNGMISQFRELALLLEQKINVYGIQARGLKPGTRMAESPWEMVDDYFRQIRAVQPKGPYTLGGFCSGNQIAYEIALKMEQSHIPVEKLVLVDSHLFFSNFYFRLLPVLKFLPGFVEKILVAYLKRKFKKHVQNLHRLESSGHDFGEIKVDGDPLKERMRKYMDILLRYVFSFRILNAPILVPLAQDSPREGSTQENFNKVSKSGAVVIHIPGTHNSVLADPYVNKLAEVILENL